MGESAQKVAFEINTEQCGRGHSFKSISYAEQAKNAGLRITAVKYFLCGTSNQRRLHQMPSSLVRYI